MGMIEIPIKRREPVMRWIPVSERLPEENTEVLVSTTDFVYIAEMDKLYTGESYWYEVIEYRIIEDVVAWMPLPEPYQN